MKKNEFIQMKGSDLKELKVKIKALKEEIANLTLDKNMKKLKDLKMVSKKKKEMAQILTVIRQKELLVELESKIEGQKTETGPASSVSRRASSLANRSLRLRAGTPSSLSPVKKTDSKKKRGTK